MIKPATIVLGIDDYPKLEKVVKYPNNFTAAFFTPIKSNVPHTFDVVLQDNLNFKRQSLIDKIRLSNDKFTIGKIAENLIETDRIIFINRDDFAAFVWALTTFSHFPIHVVCYGAENVSLYVKIVNTLKNKRRCIAFTQKTHPTHRYGIEIKNPIIIPF